jgi:ribose transport system ATP-binding protein
MLAVARALQDGDEATSAGILVLDEPTAALPHHEAQLLLSTLRRLAKSGRTVLFISHHLAEILHLVDRVSVLRDGMKVATVDADTLTEPGLVELIVGRPLDRVFPDAPHTGVHRAVLKVDGLSAGPLRNLTFAVGEGEILGIAGLLGSGRSTLLRTLFGEINPTAGRIVLGGNDLRAKNPAQAMAADVAYVPEDRAGEAALADLSLCENLSAAIIPYYWRRLRLARRAEHRDATALLRDFHIKHSSPAQSLRTLSGGNQQKVILARWLRRRPRLLLLDEPTQGVDIGARADIYRTLRAVVDTGTSVLLVASDFDELARVSDRVLVLRGGHIVAQVRPPHLDAATLTRITLATDKERAS